MRRAGSWAVVRCTDTGWSTPVRIRIAKHAKWGRRLRRYDPDPATAPTVRRIFAQRLAGCSTSRIAAGLNDDGVPCPSRVDRERNPHRSGAGWALTTVRAVLSNAKYTGRQVWNRQPGRYTPPHLPGPFKTQRWASTDQWVISKHLAHPALVSEADFIAAQQITALPAPRDSGVREYRLAGCCAADRVGAASIRAGRMAALRTVAGTATPARSLTVGEGQRTSMSART